MEINRPPLTELAIAAAVADTENWIRQRLAEKGTGAIVSAHEALGIVTEEYLELAEAVRRGDTAHIIHESLDLAVAALVIVASLHKGA